MAPNWTVMSTETGSRKWLLKNVATAWTAACWTALTTPANVMLNAMTGSPHFVMVFSADYVFVTNEANPGRALESMRKIEAKPRFCYNS